MASHYASLRSVTNSKARFASALFAVIWVVFTPKMWAQTAGKGVDHVSLESHVQTAAHVADAVTTLATMPEYFQNGEAESLAKTLPAFEQLTRLTEPLIGEDIHRIEIPLPLPLHEADYVFQQADGVIRRKPMHYYHVPRIDLIEKMWNRVGVALPAANAPKFSIKTDVARIKRAIAVLKVPNGDTSENPWLAIFDGVQARAHSMNLGAPVMLFAGAPVREDRRKRALTIMAASLNNASPTAAFGRIFLANGLRHDEVKERTYSNFRRASEFVVDHAHELPINFETATTLNAMLTDGLVDDDIRGRPYHGDAAFHKEVEQFYELFGLERVKSFMRHYPAAMAHWLHYIISLQDALPDANGRTSKLMADLALLQAGMAPAYYPSMDDYFAKGGPRSSLSWRQRWEYFRRVVALGQSIMIGPELSIRYHYQPSPDLTQSLVNSPYHNGAPKFRETRGSLIDFLTITTRLDPDVRQTEDLHPVDQEDRYPKLQRVAAR